MFNSLLNRKEKMGYILFYWLIIVVSVGLGIQFYKWVAPEKFIKINYEYKIITQSDLGNLKNGDSVKFNGFNLCVSSIIASNFKNTRGDEATPPVEINLRQEGDCI